MGIECRPCGIRMDLHGLLWVLPCAIKRIFFKALNYLNGILSLLFEQTSLLRNQTRFVGDFSFIGVLVLQRFFDMGSLWVGDEWDVLHYSQMN